MRIGGGRSSGHLAPCCLLFFVFRFQAALGDVELCLQVFTALQTQTRHLARGGPSDAPRRHARHHLGLLLLLERHLVRVRPRPRPLQSAEPRLGVLVLLVLLAGVRVAAGQLGRGVRRGRGQLLGARDGDLRSAANRLIGEVIQSRRRPLLGPSPG